MDRKERFIKAYNWLKYEGVIRTQEDVAVKMQTTRPNVSLALNGKETALTDNFIARFCAAYTQISYTWLLLGRGEMLSDQSRTILDRVREVLKLERKTAAELGEEYGGELVNLQEYIDHDEEPNVRTVSELCRALNLNMDWVLRGVGSPKDEEEEHIKPTTVAAAIGGGSGNTKPRLPVCAVTGGLTEFLSKKKEHYTMMPVIKQFSEYDFTMYVRDESMEPKYEKGDEIALKQVVCIKEWGKEYAIDTEDGIFFKTIYDEGDKVRCVSLRSDKYHDFLVPKHAIVGYFRLVGLIRV